jgi:L-amino acid N-acyltransferase YncA
MLIIRPASENDLVAITEIYNEAILNTTATFDTESKTPEEQAAWFAKHGDKYPLLVAELEGRVIGWASLSQYSDRCAYSETAEASLYIRPDFRGRGIGQQLTDKLLAAGQKAGLHSLLVRITEGNQASLHIVELFGFQPVGVMKEVGRKFGKRLDVHILQKIY